MQQNMHVATEWLWVWLSQFASHKMHIGTLKIIYLPKRNVGSGNVTFRDASDWSVSASSWSRKPQVFRISQDCAI